MSDDERILAELASGPKRTEEVAGVVVSCGQRGCDMRDLHRLWEEGRVAWDWGLERWRLPRRGPSGS